MDYHWLLIDAQPVGHATDPETLADLIEQAIVGSPGLFKHFDRAVGGPRSCRILYQERIPPYTETDPLLEPHSSTAAAWQFFNGTFVSQVRRDPPTAPNATSKEGWEVCKIVRDGKPIVIILATWVN